MRKITQEEILCQLCEYAGITGEEDVPVSYRTFRNAMKAGDLFTTNNTIKGRWEQLIVQKKFITQVKKSRTDMVIFLDMAEVKKFLLEAGITPSTFKFGGKSVYTHTERNTHSATEAKE